MARIRRARPADVSAIAGLWADLMRHHQKRAGKLSDHYALQTDAGKSWRKWLRKWMRSKDGLILVAEDHGRLAGYSLSFIKKNVPVYRIRRLGYLSDLYVADGYRNKGIGTAFFRKARAWFRWRGVKYASIAVHEINPGARRIYKGWGFLEFHHELRLKL